MDHHNHWYIVEFKDRGPVITFAKTPSDARRRAKEKFSGCVKLVKQWKPDNIATFKGVALSNDIVQQVGATKKGRTIWLES